MNNSKINVSKYKFWSYIIGGAIAVIIAIIIFFEPELAIGLLSANIIFLFGILQFLFEHSFREQNDKIDSINESISSKMQDISGIMQLEEVNKMILDVKDNSEKIQYQNILKKSLNSISNYVKEKRSGELEPKTYYNLLKDAGTKILNEKNSTIISYSGEIRALTFCLIDELNTNNRTTGEFERDWIEQMEMLDAKGVPTRRLWVFDDEKRKLLSDGKSNDTIRFLNEKLKMYCIKNTKFTKTTSKVILIDSIEGDIEQFGKGFFSIKLKDNSTILIYGVAKENVRMAKTLCGEIDYDKDRRNTILQEWEKYWSMAIPLNKYLKENSHLDVFNYMKNELDFKFDE